MDYRILGSLDVRVDDRPLNLGVQRQRRILATLLLDANRVVPLSRLVEAAWGADPPETAYRQAQSRIADLRKSLTPAGGLIDTVATGYRLRVGPGELDVEVFEELAARGEADGDAVVLRQALRLWRGPALAGLDGELLAREAARLDERRLAVWEACFELELAGTVDESLVAELTELVAAHPVRERFTAQLMTVLHRFGRRDEALAAYRNLAGRLSEEFGLDPSSELRHLRDQMLAVETTVPAQLPHEVRGFVGRVDDLATLDDLLSAGRTGRAAVISSIAGTPGVGKTTLAVHWAHGVRDKFPDGQLYVNLRGFDPDRAVLPPERALQGFLRALGVPPQRIPGTLDEQIAQYRLLLTGKRVLIVLDNARDADHVRPLLSTAAENLVIITSRSLLTDLVHDGAADPITLDLLSPEESRDLLARRLGADRLDAEPAAVERIIARCARLPLALAIVAARAIDTDVSLQAVAAKLGEQRADLGPFDDEDPRADVRAVFSWSYTALSAPAARLFRLLGLHAGPDFPVEAAASLVAGTVDAVRPLVAELAGANLVAEAGPGRYTMHDLLHAYAAEQARVVDSDADRHTATRRLLDHYVHSARAAVRQINPTRNPMPPRTCEPGAVVLEFASRDAAVQWLEAEYAVMRTAIDDAEELFDDHVWQLAYALAVHLLPIGNHSELFAMQRIARAAADRTGYLDARARVLHDIGITHARTRRYDEATGYLEQAGELFVSADDRVGRAAVHVTLAYVSAMLDDYPAALRHTQRSAELYELAGDRVGRVRALNSMSGAYTGLGDYDRAIACSEESLAVYEELGDVPGTAGVWDDIGCAHHAAGRTDEAAVCYDRSLRLYRGIGARLMEGDMLKKLGDLGRDTGDPAGAVAFWRAAMEIFDDIGYDEAEDVRAEMLELEARL